VLAGQTDAQLLVTLSRMITAGLLPFGCTAERALALVRGSPAGPPTSVGERVMLRLSVARPPQAAAAVVPTTAAAAATLLDDAALQYPVEAAGYAAGAAACEQHSTRALHVGPPLPMCFDAAAAGALTSPSAFLR
jgi:hypothetical protein